MFWIGVDVLSCVNMEHKSPCSRTSLPLITGSSWTNRLSVVVLLVVVIACCCYPCRAQEISEYCWNDAFNATCDPGHVILITHARVGRMRVGRCLTTEYFIGCEINVRPAMDRLCSGRQTCVIDPPHGELFKDQNRPCRQDLVVYLEAAYKCIPVSTPSDVQCHGDVRVDVSTGAIATTHPEASSTVHATTGYLASATTRDSGVGGSQCPWLIRVAPGQHIKLTLIDFSTSSSSTRPGTQCRVYALVREPTRDKSKRICPSTYMGVDQEAQRESLVYTTRSNTLEVVIMNSSRHTDNFLLKYEATGCADFQPQPGVSQDRRGNTLSLSCGDSGPRKNLVCSDTQWVGNEPNCSVPGSHRVNVVENGKRNELSKEKSYSPGLLIAIGIGIVIGIALGFVFLIIVFKCRWRRESESAGRMTSLLVDGQPGGPGMEDNQHNAYKLVEVTCDHPPPVPDLACDCFHAEIRAHQTRLGDGEGTIKPEHRHPCIVGSRDQLEKALSVELLHRDMRRGGGELPWPPSDTYRPAQSDTYPRLTATLVSFGGDQCNSDSNQTPAHRVTDPECQECRSEAQRAGDMLYYSGS